VSDVDLDEEQSDVLPLSAKQQRALDTLLVGGTDQQAAEAADVSRGTVQKWRTRTPEFMEALATARSELFKRSGARLHAASTLAVKALEDVVKERANATARISAARTILEFSLRARGVEEVEDRIEELEKWMKEQQDQ